MGDGRVFGDEVPDLLPPLPERSSLSKEHQGAAPGATVCLGSVLEPLLLLPGSAGRISTLQSAVGAFLPCRERTEEDDEEDQTDPRVREEPMSKNVAWQIEKYIEKGIDKS